MYQTHSDESKLIRLIIKSYIDSFYTQYHMLGHAGLFLHVCSQCPKKFRTSNTLKMHIAGCHFNERKNKCPECGKGFWSKTDVKRHLRVHERDEESEIVNEVDS